MAKHKNEFRVVAFDPGGTIGWAYFAIHRKAFVNPRNTILGNLLSWKTGQFQGHEFEQIDSAMRLMRYARYEPKPFVADCNFVSEDFQLTQLIGGKDLLSPVRVNAVLDYECAKNTGLRLQLQNRNLRTSVTKERLQYWKLWPVKGKDSFAAMQHAVTWLRRVKREANQKPWKLYE